MLAILVVQTIFMRTPSRHPAHDGVNYDAAVLAAGHQESGLGATRRPPPLLPCAGDTDRFGPRIWAFPVVPMVGAFSLSISSMRW